MNWVEETFTSNSTQIIVLSILIVLDYVTGIIKSLIHKNLSSKIGTQGLVKKGMILLAYTFTLTLDFYSSSHMLTTIYSSMVIFNESISIVENFKDCGVDVSFVKKIFNKKGDGENN